MDTVSAGMQQPRARYLQADAEAVPSNAGYIRFRAVDPVRGGAHLAYDGAGNGACLKRPPESVATIRSKFDRHAEQAFAAHLAPLVEAVLGLKVIGCETDDGVRGLLLPEDPCPGGLFFRRAKLQMNERIGSLLPIEVGTSRRLETEPTIKAHCLRVLLIHIGGQRRRCGERRLYERPSNPFAMLVRIDEKRLHMAFMQKHETKGLIGCIDRERQGDLRQKSRHFLLDRDAICRKKEVMSSVDGPAPYFKDAGRVASVGRAKCNHVLTLSNCQLFAPWGRF